MYAGQGPRAAKPRCERPPLTHGRVQPFPSVNLETHGALQRSPGILVVSIRLFPTGPRATLPPQLRPRADPARPSQLRRVRATRSQVTHTLHEWIARAKRGPRRVRTWLLPQSRTPPSGTKMTPIRKSVGRTVAGVRIGCHAFSRCCLNAVSARQAGACQPRRVEGGRGGRGARALTEPATVSPRHDRPCWITQAWRWTYSLVVWTT